ncbi:MAG: hypothetical protein HQL11_05535, partial [Candidatus Omnitrophica bacterium]|nr:hypothetical protein [Candidatus Omnitrophota bacterium]
FEELVARGASPEEIFGELHELVWNFTRKQRYGLAHRAEVRTHLYDLMRAGVISETVRVIPGLLDANNRYQTLRRDLRRRYPDGYRYQAEGFEDARLLFLQVAEASYRLGVNYQLLGERLQARRMFKVWEGWLHRFQSYELGVKATELQLDLVRFYLQSGEPDLFLKNLRILLTGQGYPDLKYFRYEEKRMQMSWMQYAANVLLGDSRDGKPSEAPSLFQMENLVDDINYYFGSMLSYEVDPAKLDNARRAFNETRQLINDFLRHYRGKSGARMSTAEKLDEHRGEVRGLSVGDAARVLGVAESTLRRYLQRTPGEAEAFGIGAGAEVVKPVIPDPENSAERESMPALLTFLRAAGSFGDGDFTLNDYIRLHPEKSRATVRTHLQTLVTLGMALVVQEHSAGVSEVWKIRMPDDSLRAEVEFALSQYFSEPDTELVKTQIERIVSGRLKIFLPAKVYDYDILARSWRLRHPASVRINPYLTFRFLAEHFAGVWVKRRRLMDFVAGISPGGMDIQLEMLKESGVLETAPNGW